MDNPQQDWIIQETKFTYFLLGMALEIKKKIKKYGEKQVQALKLWESASKQSPSIKKIGIL